VGPKVRGFMEGTLHHSDSWHDLNHHASHLAQIDIIRDEYRFVSFEPNPGQSSTIHVFLSPSIALQSPSLQPFRG
jgi:hypothetical protein